MSFNVKIEEDKFVGKKTYWGPNMTLKTGNALSDFFRAPTICIRKLESPNINSPIIDYTVSDDSGWMNITKGYMIILVDGETIRVEAQENYKNHDVNYNTSYNSSTKEHETRENHEYTESAYYQIDETILERIAEARNLRLKVYGRNYEREISNPEKFQNYVRAFYNKVYDHRAYLHEAETFQVGMGNTMRSVLGALILFGIGFAIVLLLLYSLDLI